MREPPFKYTKTTTLLAVNTKKQLLELQIWENPFCSIVGEWYKELKVKEFCVFDYIELLYRATMF